MKVLTIKEFLESQSFNQFEESTKEIIKVLLRKLAEDGIGLFIKLRNDNAIAIVPETNNKKNICTLMIYKKHIKVKILNEYEKNIVETEDIDNILINTLKSKYNQIIEEKVQMSIYLDKSVADKLNEEAKRTGIKAHDIIIESINKEMSKNEYFLNESHKNEFSILIKDSGLYDNEKYIYGLEEKQSKAVALFYVIAAYQEYYLKLEGTKFTSDSETRQLSGPAIVIDNWHEGSYNSHESMYGLITTIINGEEINILEHFEECYDDEMIYLLKNSLKILVGKLTIREDEIVQTKLQKLKVDPSFKW